MTIEDNDTEAVELPVVSFDATRTRSTVNEGRSVSVRVNINPAPTEEVTVGFTSAVTGTNAADDDVELDPEEEVVFAAGQRVKLITVTAEDDADTTEETLTLTLSADPDAGTDDATYDLTGAQTTHEVVITDDGIHTVTLTRTSGGIGDSNNLMEGATNGSETATLTVTLDPASTTRAFTVPISVSPSSGDFELGGTDLVNNRVTFAANETTKTFTVTAEDDADSDDEEVTFTLRPPSGSKAGEDDSVKLALIDATRPTLSFARSSYLATENGDPATVTVTLDPPSPKEVTVQIGPDSATAANPFLLSADELVFPAGQGSQTITVVATADPNITSSNVVLEFGTVTPANARVSATGGVHTTTDVTLADDGQRTVSFTTFTEGTTYTAVEGGAAVTVTVSLSANLATGASATVPITFMPASGDFELGPDTFDGTLTFDDATQTQTFTITAEEDDNAVDETIALGFGALPVSLRAGSQSTATVTLDDDESAPVSEDVIVEFAAAAYTATENGADATVEIMLASALEDEVKIALTTTPETGSFEVSGLTKGMVIFPAGETRQMVTVTATADTDTDNATVTLTLDATGDDAEGVTTTGGQTTTLVTLVDDGVAKGTIGFDAATATATEGTALDIGLTLARATGDTRVISIPITTDPPSGDFVLSPPDMVTFGDGVTTATISLTMEDLDDVESEDMKVKLELGAVPADLIPGTSATTITLADDDRAAYEVTIAAADTNIDEDGGKTDLTITLSAEPDRDLTIPISVDDTSTAEEGDFTLSATEVVYRKGDKGGKLAQKITLTAVNDNSIDAGLTVVVGFDDLPGGVTATSGSETATVIIDDDDTERTINFGMANYAAVEGGANAMIVVTLDAAAGRDITLPITTDPKSGPFELSVTELTFGEDDMTKTIMVTAMEDSNGVDDMVELSFAAKDRTAAGIAATGTTDTATVTLVDDRNVMATVSFGAATYEAMEGGDAATVDGQSGSAAALGFEEHLHDSGFRLANGWRCAWKTSNCPPRW